MRSSWKMAVLALCLSACGASPPPQTAAPPPPDPPAEAEARTAGPLPLLDAGPNQTCVLGEGRLRCTGELTFARDVDADLLSVGDVTACVARSGAPGVRCFGDIEPPPELEREWEEECDYDEECFEQRLAAHADSGLLLSTRGPVIDLAGWETQLCALTRDEVVCWDLLEDEVTQSASSAPSEDGAELEATLGRLCVRTNAGAVRCREAWDSDDAEALTRIEGLPRVERLGVAGEFACAWTASGEAHCWGSYFPGDEELELDEATARRAPVFDGVRAMSANASASAQLCVLDADGSARCWGDNRYGALGPIRAGQTQSTPIDPGLRDLARIAVSVHHTCAIRQSGTLMCWGRADRGALGQARRRAQPSPVEVANVRADALALYGDRSCARTAGGWTCWGRGYTEQPRVAPWEPRRIELPSSATPVALRYTDCALAGGTLRCPRAAGELVAPAQAVVSANSCVLTPQRTVRCYGPRWEASEVEGARDVVAIAGGLLDLFTLSADGELARYRSASDVMQRQQSAREGSARQLALTSAHACVLRGDGEVACGPRHRLEPFERVALPSRAEQLVHGREHVCARTRDAEVYCWGASSQGQLARLASSASSNLQPVPIPQARGAVEIAAGHWHTCARSRDGRVVCWGADADGQLGARPPWWQDGPVEVELPR